MPNATDERDGAAKGCKDRSMTAIVLDGEALAAEIKADLKTRIDALAERGVVPGLATLLVGDDGPSANYVAMKHRDSAELGIASFDERLPADAAQADIDAIVDELNDNPDVDAYLMQYPFPDGLDYHAALLRVDPAKDVDGLHPTNLGNLVAGEPGPRPCTPVGIQRLLILYSIFRAFGHHVDVLRWRIARRFLKRSL